MSICLPVTSDLDPVPIVYVLSKRLLIGWFHNSHDRIFAWWIAVEISRLNSNSKTFLCLLKSSQFQCPDLMKSGSYENLAISPIRHLLAVKEI